MKILIFILDPDDPEYVRQLRRPAEVKEDISGMEKRKRVDMILHVSGRDNFVNSLWN